MDHRKIKLAVGLLIMVAIIVLGYVAFISTTAVKAGAIFKPDDTQIVTKGAELYVANCASCHGVELQGQPDWRKPGLDRRMPAPPHNETGHTWHHSDDVLFGITKYGVAEFSGLKDYQSNMPIYEEILNDDEIIAVLSFIKSKWPKVIKDRHDEMNLQSVGK